MKKNIITLTFTLSVLKSLFQIKKKNFQFSVGMCMHVYVYIRISAWLTYML